jgi:cysteine-rich repeat protein
MVSALTNNGILVPSIAPNAKIMIAKGFSDTGAGTISDLSAALVYAAMNGADVINNSWGCASPCPSNPLAESAVDTAYGLGAVVVFAAGNDEDDVGNYSPQNMKPEVITVAANDHNDEHAFFSNFGPEIDVSAPGYDVYSLSPFDQIAVAQGTSFSAPLASGVAALVISQHPTMTNAQIRWILRYTADDIDDLGFDDNTGAGRINAHQALVLDKVLPMFINHPGQATVTTGFILDIQVSTFDFANDVRTIDAELAGGAPVTSIGASFTDFGNGFGRFTWAPVHAQAGLDPQVVFTVTDAPGGFTATATTDITVLLGSGICGNNILEAGEECDDNNTDGGDGCSKICTIEICGNLVLDVGEGCDNDTGPVSGDGCSNVCVIEFCGDSIVNNNNPPQFEECDDGVQTATCSGSCLSIICGNGRVDFGEDCDDAGDSPDCDINCNWKDTSCGNGRVDVGEECDDDNNVPGDGCDAVCVDEFCGDGIINDSNEECDTSAVIPPSSFDFDGCSAICKNQFCGNDVVDVVLGEECDGTLGCSTACLLQALAVCGNGMCESDRSETCSSCFADCGYCRGLRPR